MFKMDTQMQFNPFASASAQQQQQQQQFEMQQQQQQMMLFQQQQQMQMHQQHQQPQHMSALQHDDEEMEEDAEMTEMKTSDSQLGFGNVPTQSIPSHPFAHLNQHAKGAPSPVKPKMNEQQQQQQQQRRAQHGAQHAHLKTAAEEEEEADESEYDEDDDEDEDDFDELDEQMMRQMMLNASPDSQNVIKLIISGYSACASETLRYLIEEENLPANSPTLIGLIKHLKMQETMLIMNCLRTQHLQQQLIAQQQQILQQQAQQAQPQQPTAASTAQSPTGQTQLSSAQQMHLLQQQQALHEQQQRLQAAAMNLPSPPHSHGSQSPQNSNSPSPLLRGHSPATLSPLSSGQSSPTRLVSPPAHPTANHTLTGQPLSNSPLQAEPFASSSHAPHHQQSASMFSSAASLSNFGSTMNAFSAPRQSSANEPNSAPGPFGGFRPNHTSSSSLTTSSNSSAATSHPFANQGVLSSFSRTAFADSC